MEEDQVGAGKAGSSLCPSSRLLNVSNNGLATFTNLNSFDANDLGPAAPEPTQRFY
jgi:hypothetical protein